MQTSRFLVALFVLCTIITLNEGVGITVNYLNTTLSNSVPTLQVVVNPLITRDSPIHDEVYTSLAQLGARYVRWVPWLPYPQLAVAELYGPNATDTFWNFTLLDPLFEDFWNATHGYNGDNEVIINFSTTPEWLWVGGDTVEWPANPEEVFWSYEQGTTLVDPTVKTLATYYARLLAWYTQGGFTDENGNFHDSGHYYNITMWEILNEVDAEHSMSPQFYTQVYDAMVTAMSEVNPDLKFVGLALSNSGLFDFFSYFLDRGNHLPNIPIDYISYHFYATVGGNDRFNVDAYESFFPQADDFFNNVDEINKLITLYSYGTKVDTDELGIILPGDNSGIDSEPLPPLYWNAAGAFYAYVYANLCMRNISIIGESQLVGYPSQFPSVTMLNYTTGEGNARYWVLYMLLNNLVSNIENNTNIMVDTLVLNSTALYAQTFIVGGVTKMLLVNKLNAPVTADFIDMNTFPVSLVYVDETTGWGPPEYVLNPPASYTLNPFGVAIIEFN